MRILAPESQTVLLGFRQKNEISLERLAESQGIELKQDTRGDPHCVTPTVMIPP